MDTRTSYLAKPTIAGKFFELHGTPFILKGCTYGPLEPDADNNEYTDTDKLHRDFLLMRQHGFNFVRIPHTVPLRSVLDIAIQYDLYVMVSLSCEHSLDFAMDRKKKRNVLKEIEAMVRRVKGHSALLAYALGNEIRPAQVRWYGPRKVERFLRRVTRTVRSLDPSAYVTYVNFPTTEYLQLNFLDFLSFNVYIEDRERYAAYLPRLQNLAGDRPLVLSETGMDSLQAGEARQAEVLAWALEESYAAGCAGVCIFAWTDEWFVKHLLTDWAFGLTRIDRSPKPALQVVGRIFQNVPFKRDDNWPLISVVVCSYNGANTIDLTLRALSCLAYPNYEVLIIDDGSTDATPAMVRRYPFKLISTANHGLSAARNTGWQEARGEIIAYLDDDAFPHPYWLHFIADCFRRHPCSAVGGPNMPPLGKSLVADAIAHAPGGPKAVLVTDTEAEHIPGCNMCIRRDVLLRLKGFDPQFRVAGDDVDICWRILEDGGMICFHAGAFVWHFARQTIPKYWKQQAGYGKAEALLEAKWPNKYNNYGHLSWRGRIYGNGVLTPIFMKWSVYHGEWGLAPFQLRQWETPGWIPSWTIMPEWYLIISTFFVLSLGGILWPPLNLLWILGAGALAVACLNVFKNLKLINFRRSPFFQERPWSLRLVTAACYFLQPVARLYGRIRYRLKPWWKKPFQFYWPLPITFAHWSDEWTVPSQRLQRVESVFHQQGFLDRRGGPFDRWDLQIRGGIFGKARIFIAMDSYHAPQMVRIRIKPLPRLPALLALGFFALCALITLFSNNQKVALFFFTIVVLFGLLTCINIAVAVGVARKVLKESL
ncbi:glycosyltransferase [Oligoflexus tunisiensis]|uniref:glycosyltransferase n=1 Tax=Oligoflexus tunisiensis TaxID=708132 RepID=UPI000A5FBDBE|nr:glycosyltransferase [Oligoflexus tunisiensis]